MDEMQVFIDMANHTILNAPTFGPFQIYTYLQGYEVEKYKGFISDEIYEKLRMNKFDIIENYMLKQGYIDIGSNNQVVKLSGIGRDIKTKKGIEQYTKFIEDRDNAIFENIKWAKISAEAAQRSATANELPARDTNITKILIAIYTAVTLISTVALICTCHDTHLSQVKKTIAQSSIMDTTASIITDTVK